MTTDVVERLRQADERYRELEADIEEIGPDRVEAVADAYDRATGLLDEYEDQATGTGTEEFRAFVKFQEELAQFVEDLGEELRHREAFESMEETLDKRRVSESDFQRARDMLAPARETAELVEDRQAARAQYRQARRAVIERRNEIDAEIDDLERLVELGEADLDAPVERLREPIRAYNEAVRDAFETFRSERSAREVFEFVAVTADYPLVDVDQPPGELRTYVEEYAAGTEPIPTLLEYSEFSRSKLSHYVEDPDELKRRVTTHQTYLRRLDGDPFTIAWPPAPAEQLRFRTEELIAVCSRFGDDDLVERVRTVRALPRETEYERLRSAAVATDQLSEAQRERLATGDVAEELASLRTRRSELSDVLSELPER